MVVIVGTNLSDTLTGTLENDRIFGKAGDDALSGSLGDDLLFGNNGNDLLDGNDGKDSLLGGNRDDYIFGGSDEDFLSGGRGNDFLYGGNGNDYLQGGKGNDILEGAGANSSPGRLVTFGSGTIDQLTGEAGEDTFVLRGGYIPIGVHPYYLDGGDSDYALITDFDKSEDSIQLLTQNIDDAGALIITVEYDLGASPSGLPSGTGIFVKNLGTQPDLIAILQNIAPDSVSFSEPYFQFLPYI